MRKTCKFLFLVLLSMLIICNCAFSVKAADTDGYVDYDAIYPDEEEKTDADDGKKDDNNKTEGTNEEDGKKDGETSNETTGENGNKTEGLKGDDAKTDNSESDKNDDVEDEENVGDKADTPHVQAGAYEKTVLGAIGAVAISVIVFAYFKLKKYNY